MVVATALRIKVAAVSYPRWKMCYRLRGKRRRFIAFSPNGEGSRSNKATQQSRYCCQKVSTEEAVPRTPAKPLDDSDAITFANVSPTKLDRDWRRHEERALCAI
mmetsp:Transcript_17381/g.40555  ORF Transcript_17381/g.40555 Transcript_17381/m.40555 type:complete len:104 (-) Transcript_17381:11-322(-)